jgi:HD-GYP domain-containing protein (c-di-GMP phosphodiesterase class II)
MAVEFRDEDTGAHTDRIGHFSARLARAVGKVAVPDSVLLKAGPLTDSERASMQTHARTGHRLLGGSSSALLDLAASMALSHHEKWDGSGYPQGLAGDEIPIEGRIVAIADVFDALTTSTPNCWTSSSTSSPTSTPPTLLQIRTQGAP